MAEVTDPALLQQLEGGGGGSAPTEGGAVVNMSWLNSVTPKPVTDPSLLKQLEGQQGYSYGPISDVAELGARGINWLTQQLPESVRPAAREPQPMGQPVNLPLIGQPSAVGIGKSLYESATDAATLPGDVYAGKVDPLSDEGIKRSFNFATVASTAPSSIPSVVRREAAPALASKDIIDVAETGYTTLRNEGRAGALPKGTLDEVADAMHQHVLEHGPSPKRVQSVFDEINGLRTPRTQGDVGDLVDTRRNLMDIVRGGTRRDAMGNITAKPSGEERTAALQAVRVLDDFMGPDLVKQMKQLDKNYAIGLGSQKVDRAIDQAKREAEQSGSGGNIANKIRQRFQKIPAREDFQKKYSPEEQAAILRTTEPSWADALRPLSIFDPTRHKLSMYGQLMATPFTASAGILPALGQGALAAGGYGARRWYDSIIENRARGISEAMRQQAPATQMMPGYYAGGPMASTYGGPLPYALAAPRQQQP